MSSNGETRPGDARFTHAVRVGWADCDPARIAFTGRIPYFCLEAIDAWWEFAVGEDWFAMNIDRDIGSPFVHMSLDFRSPVTPRHRLICTVRLIHLGASSVRFRVCGFQDDVLCFAGEFAEAFVHSRELKKMAIPASIRQSLEPLLEPMGGTDE